MKYPCQIQWYYMTFFVESRQNVFYIFYHYSSYIEIGAITADTSHFSHNGALGQTESHKEELTTTYIGASHHSGCPPSFCHNGGTCLKGTGGYTCNCKQGYHGLFCDGNILFLLIHFIKILNQK